MEPYKFSELVYEPNCFEKVQEKVNNFTKQVREAASVWEICNCIAGYDALMEEVNFACTLAYIRSSLDCTDSYYAEAIQKESAGYETVETSEYCRALLESPFLPQLEEKFGKEFRPRLEKEFRINRSGHELKAKEQVLISKYQQKKAMLKIPFQGKEYSEAEMYVFFDSPDRQVRIDSRKAVAKAVLEKKEEFAPFLLELISLRDQIAKANDFENYLEYADAVYDRRGYGESEMTAFCTQVKEELVPLLKILQEEQKQELGVEKLMTYDYGIRFADGNAVPKGDAAYLTESSKAMYDALSPQMGAFFRGMVETESLDVTASPNKVAGMGFCTGVKRTCYPYVFGNCNGTETDVTVFTHEIGHAWQEYLTTKENRISLLHGMCLDAVEIPSKTMELFAFPYAEGFFGKDAEKFRQGHFRNALREIASYCEIHEMNTWIYTHVGASFEELVAKEEEIARAYDPNLDYGELTDDHRRGADLMRNMAIYMFPRYVISYSLSEVCAMDLFARMQKEPQAAWESYEKLCASGGSRSYPDTLNQAGLQPAYAEGSVKRVAEFAKSYLKIQ